jgi:6-phosphogluconolactonase
VKAKGGPRHLTFSPDQRFVYLLNELDAAIYAFPFDAASGTLRQEVQIASALPPGFAGTPWGADIHLTPHGNFLYASERTTSTIAAFRIDKANGALAPIASYPTEQQPRGFAIDGLGRFLIAAGQVSHSLTVHAIDQNTGVLTALRQYAAGKNPNWVEIVTP